MHRSNSRRAALGSFLSDFSPLDKKARQLLRGRRRTASAVRAWAESLEIRTLLSVNLVANMTGPTSPVRLGDQAIYQLTVTNIGSEDALEAQVDVYPRSGINTFQSPVVRELSGPPTVQFDFLEQIPLLASGNSVKFQVTQPVPTGDAIPPGIMLTSFIETAMLTYTSDGSGRFLNVDEPTQVAPTTRLAASISAPSRIPSGGGPVALNLTVTNMGPTDAQNVDLINTLPSELTFQNVTQTSGPAFNVLSASPGSATIQLQGASLPTGASATFQLDCTAAGSATVAMPFEDLLSADGQTVNGPALPATANAFMQYALPVDLAVDLTGLPVAVAGTSLIQKYDVSIDDIGLNPPQSAVLSYTIPQGFSLVSITGVSGPNLPPAGTTGTFSIPVAAPSKIEIGETSSPSIPDGTVVTQSAVVTTTPADSDTSNNSASFNVFVATSANMAATINGPATATPGSTATYTLTVTNSGQSDAQNASFSDILPGGTTFVSLAQTSGPAFTLATPASGGNGTVSGQLAVLPRGSATFQLILRLATNFSGTQLSNTLTVSSSTTDGDGLSNNTATAVSQVMPQADLSVAETGPANVAAGNNATYTFTVTNNGPSDATNVVVNDVLPGQAGFFSLILQSSPPFTFGGPHIGGTGTVVVQIPLLAVHSSASFNVSCSVFSNAPAGTLLFNNVSASSDAVDLNPADNTASVSTTVTALDDLSVRLTPPKQIIDAGNGESPPVPKAVVVAGQNATFILSVSNTGPSDASNVVLSNPLPAGASFISVAQTSGPTFSFTPPTGAGSALIGTISDLPKGASAQFNVTYLPAPGTAGANFVDNATITSDVTDSTPSNNTATSTVPVLAPADLSISLVGPSIFAPGAFPTYFVVVSNQGDVIAGAATITFTVPAIAPLNNIGTNNGFTGLPSVGAGFVGPITFTLPAGLVAGNVASIGFLESLSPSLPAGLLVMPTASISGVPATDDPSNNSATFTTTLQPQADLAVTQTAPATATAGSNVTFNFTVTNNGPSDATNVVLNDALPGEAGFFNLNFAIAPPFTFGGPHQGASGNVVINIPLLPVHASATFNLTTTVFSNASAGDMLTNTVTATSNASDFNTANNTSTIAASVTTAADLSVRLTPPTQIIDAGNGESPPSPKAVVVAGQNATFILSVSNTGPSDARNVVLTNPLPAGASFVSVIQTSGPTFTFVPPTGAGSALIGTIPVLPKGASAQFSVTYLPDPGTAGTTFHVSANVANDATDPAPSNNSATSNVPVLAPADLALTLVGPSVFPAGAFPTYFVSIVNDGDVIAGAATVAFTVPPNAALSRLGTNSGFTGVPNLPSGYTGPITFTLPAGLVAGNVASIGFLEFIPPSTPAGTLVMPTATISGVPSIDDPSNNSAALTTTVFTEADVAVSESGPTDVVAGTNATYTFTVTNNGISDAQAVHFADTLPDGMTFVSVTQTGGPALSFATPAIGAAGTVSADISTLAAHTSATFQLVGQLSSQALAGTGTLVNTGTISTTTGGDNAANDSASVTSNVQTSADVAVTLVRSATVPPPVVSGDTGKYDITVTNSGPSAAQNVAINDQLPVGARFVSLVDRVSHAAVTPVLDGTGGVHWSIPSLPPSLGSAQFELTYQLGDGSRVPTLTDSISVTSDTPDPNLANNSASSSLTLAPATVAISGPATWPAGITANYIVSIAVPPGSGGRPAVLTLTVPDAVAINSIQAPNGLNIPGGVVGGSGTFYIPINTAIFPLDFVVRETIPASVPDGTVLLQSATMDYDPSTTTTFQTVVTTQADVSAAIAGPPSETPGTNAQFALTVANSGSSDATNVAINAVLPSFEQFVSISSSGFFQWSNTPDNPLTITMLRLPPHGSQTFNLTVAIPPDVPTGTSAVHQISVSSPTSDPDATNNSASLTTPVVGSADIALAITPFAPPAIVSGQVGTLQIALSKTGPSDTGTVLLTDALPAGATLIGLTDVGNVPIAPTSSATTGTISWQLPAVQVGPAVDYLLTYRLGDVGQTLSFTDTASVTSGTPDPNPANNSATFSVALAPATIDIFGPAAFTAGTTANYIISVTGNTNGYAVVSFTQPPGMSLSSIQAPPGSTSPTPPIGTTGTFLVTVPVSKGGVTSFVIRSLIAPSVPNGTVLSPSAMLNYDPATTVTTSTTVVTQADVGIQASGPSVVTAGTTATYSVTVSNSGPSDAQSVSFSDPLPAGMTFVSVAPTSGPAVTFTTPSSGAAGTITGNIATLPAHASATFQIVAHLDSSLADGSTLTNPFTASAATTDTNSANNSASVSSSVVTQSDLALSITPVSSPSALFPGNFQTLDINVTNRGPSDAQNLVFTDTLPRTATLFSLAAGFNQPIPVTVDSAGVLHWSRSSLPGNSTGMFTLVYQLGSGNPPDYTDRASVTSDTSDPNPANNSASWTGNTSTNFANADISVSATGSSNVVAGVNATYTVRVVDNGPFDAPNLNFSDILPPGLTFVSATQTGGPAFALSTPAPGGSGTISGNIAMLPAHGSATFQIVAHLDPSIPSGSSVKNTVTIASAAPDPFLVNNSASAISTVNAQADLGISVAPSSNSNARPALLPGDIQRVEINLVDLGPSDAQNVMLADTLPAGASVVSLTAGLAQPLGYAVDPAGVVHWSRPSLPFNSTALFILTYQLGNVFALPGPETVSVAADTPDPKPTNNSASWSYTLAPAAASFTGPATIIAGTSADYAGSITGDGYTVLKLSIPPPMQVGSISGSGIVSQVVRDPVSGASYLAVQPGSFVIHESTGPSIPDGTVVNQSAMVGFNPATTATVSTTIHPSADVAVTLSAPATVFAGSYITYAISVTNNGPSDAQTVSFSDVLGSGATFFGMAQSGGPAFTLVTPIAGAPATIGGNIATLPSHASATFQLVAHVASSAGSGSSVTNAITAGSDTGDPVQANNAASTITDLDVFAELGLILNFQTPESAVEGQLIVYRISPVNGGPSDARNVVITDSLPAGSHFVSAKILDGPSFTMSAPSPGASGTVTFTTPLLAAGRIGELQVAVMLEEGTAINSVTISSDTPNSVIGRIFNTSTTVSDAPLAAVARTLTGAEGAAMNPTVATWHDGNSSAPSGDFTASINWGDGTTSAGTVVADGGGNFHVTGGHTYAEFGNYVTTVAITDDGGSTATVTGSAAISDAPLTGFGQTLVIDKKEFNGIVGQFTDGNTLNTDPTQYTATINWGDGTTSVGTIAWDAASARWDVIGDHRYKKHDSYAISILVTDTGTQSVQFSSTALVINPGNDIKNDGLSDDLQFILIHK